MGCSSQRIFTYRGAAQEPRTSLKKRVDPKASGLARSQGLLGVHTGAGDRIRRVSFNLHRLAHTRNQVARDLGAAIADHLCSLDLGIVERLDRADERPLGQAKTQNLWATRR